VAATPVASAAVAVEVPGPDNRRIRRLPAGITLPAAAAGAAVATATVASATAAVEVPVSDNRRQFANCPTGLHPPAAAARAAVAAATAAPTTAAVEEPVRTIGQLSPITGRIVSSHEVTLQFPHECETRTLMNAFTCLCL
jgi:hypothetical protein